MNVLFLTDSRHSTVPFQDGSTRYRCYHVAEALRALGHRADVTTLAGYDRRTLRRYDVISLLRPCYNRRLLRLVDQCQRLNVVLTADIDDLIFIPRLAGTSPSVINGLAAEDRVRRRFSQHAKALELFHCVSVSTEPLAEALRECHPSLPVGVIPNGLSPQWVARAEPYATMHRLSTRLSYFSGTRSHQLDFESIREPLETFFRSELDSELMLVGELDPPRSLLTEERLMSQGSVPYANLPPLLANCRAALAPLIDTPFNRAKSHVKFIETAALCTPVVCTPIHDMKRHDVAGLAFASNNSEWASALTNVFAMSKGAHGVPSLREYVLDCCMAQHSVEHLMRLWSSASSWQHSIPTPLSALG